MSSRPQFSLRSLFVFTAVVAVGCWAVRHLWYVFADCVIGGPAPYGYHWPAAAIKKREREYEEWRRAVLATKSGTAAQESGSAH
jgi:hypothetical protein